MNLSEMLASLGDDRDDRPGLGLPEAQIDTLKLRFAALNVRHTFEPGMVVQVKEGFDFRRAPWRGQMLLVLDTDISEYNPPPAVDGLPTNRFDVACISMDPDGESTIRLYDSRKLEPVTA